ncbi:MAG: tetratricopeptide repeat protein [Chloroflexi bacterium]|nr:tetratricopeptide repeat protein [Chloroflexota bacterium]
MANNHLPIPLTRFIGREKEISAVIRASAQTRLLTLTGSGGCGKTRLALQVAARLADAFAQNIAWVEFAPLSDAALVPSAVAQILDVRESADQSLTQSLTHFLRAQQILLVFDNCEHLIAACAHLAEELLRACPQIAILATSRESLNVPGEIAWRVPPLQIPDPQITTAEVLLASESARLFIDRASLVDQTFAANPHNANAIAQICSRLDGMPLAIELAAARVKLLPVEQIAARLDDRFRLLNLGSRTAPPRHQTLRAVIDWSYGLLSPTEKILFRRLAVFAGGWTLDAAESVCSIQFSEISEEYSPTDVLDLLARLVDKSLVIAQNDVALYHMLETIREYAREKLIEANELQLLQARHCDFFVRLAEAGEPKLKGAEARQWMDRLESEYDNIRAVFEYAMANDVAPAVRLAWALVMLWVRRGYLIEGRNILMQLLARPETQGASHLRLQALKAIGYLQIYIQDSVAVRTYFEEGLAIAKMLEDEGEIAFTLHGIGRAFIFLNDYAAARPWIEESLVLYRKMGARWGEAQSLYSLGAVMNQLGDHQRSQLLLEESLEKFRALGDICDSVWPLSVLASMAREQGDLKRAIEIYDQCIEIDKHVGDRVHLDRKLISLGLIFEQQGDYHRAAQLLTEGLEIMKRRGRPIMFVYSLIGTANILREFGKPTVAARLLGAADALSESFLARGISNPGYRKLHDRVANEVRAELGAETFVSLAQVGRAMELEQAIAFALNEMKTSDLPDPRASSLSPRQAAKEKFGGLTTREREVAALIAQGKSNREIADALVLSERTIEGHVGNILDKLGFSARTQIATWAVQKGLLEKVSPRE